MTYFNPLSHLNFNFEGINNLFTPSFGVFQGFNLPIFNNILPFFNNFSWNMPSLFGFTPFSSGFTFPTNNTNIFAQPIQQPWNTGNFTDFSNYTFNFNPTPLWNNTNFGMSDTFTRSSNSSMRLQLADKAKSYVGRVNSDREGNRLFSGGKSQAWCADFVSYNIKQTYGSSLPSSFGHFSSVSELRKWGEQNNCYKQVPSSNKASYIANNVKVGDIMIEKNGGKSHTGIVTKVNSDGSFETVEGNCSNKVAIQKYKATSPTLSGFISMDKYATA